MTAKKLWHSLTIWFNGILTSLWGVLELAPEVLTTLPTIQGFLPDDKYKLLFVLATVGNVLLRFKTTTAVRL